MEITWVVFFCVLAFCIYRGYRLGLLNSLSRIVGLVVGYVIALLYYEWAAALLQRYTNVEGVLAYVIGGIALFVIANFVISLVFFITQKLLASRGPRSRMATIGGVFAGLVLGIFWGLLAVFTVSYTRDMLARADDAGTQRQHNAIERLAHDLVAKAIDKVAQLSDVDPTVRGVSTALARDPQKVSNQLRQLSQSPEVKSLFNGTDNLVVLRSADPNAITALPAFQQLLSNPDFRELMQAAGMNPDQGKDYEQQVARQFSQVWNRVQGLKNNDRVQTLLQDPTLKEQLEGRNPVQLLTNARFMELVQLVLSPVGSADKLVPSPKNDKPTSVYQWTDADGQLHFSDKPPDDAAP